MFILILIIKLINLNLFIILINNLIKRSHHIIAVGLIGNHVFN